MDSAVVALNAADARALTDRIKVGVEAIWELIKQAYEERAWDALGYISWDDYCTREFGTSRLRLPREERAEVVASLRESGLSLRAIASATGLNHQTVANDLSKSRHLPPAAPEAVAAERVSDEDAIVDELIADGYITVPDQDLPPLPDNYMGIDVDPVPPLPRPITGIDGKSYTPKPATPQMPKRKPITESFDRAKQELRSVVERIARLAADDRLKKNKDQIVDANLSDLVRARDAINSVIQQLEG